MNMTVWYTFTNILEEHAVMVKEYNIFLWNGGKYVPD